MIKFLYIVSQIPISAWLKYYKLEEYERHFKRLGIKTLEDLKRSEMCDDMMNELEVMIPGHRKRLVMAGRKRFVYPKWFKYITIRDTIFTPSYSNQEQGRAMKADEMKQF